MNPRYYERMSKLLTDLISQRRQQRISYKEYLAEITELARKVKDPSLGQHYPTTIDTPGRRALFDTVDGDEDVALLVDMVLHKECQDGWRSSKMKTRKVHFAVQQVLKKTVGGDVSVVTDEVLGVAAEHHEF